MAESGREEMVRLREWTPPPEPDQREPQTPLGRQLEQIRAEIVAAKTPLLSLEDVECEVAERRGDSGPAGTE